MWLPAKRTVLRCPALPGVGPCALGFAALALPGPVWLRAVDMGSDFPGPSGWLHGAAEERKA